MKEEQSKSWGDRVEEEEEAEKLAAQMKKLETQPKEVDAEKEIEEGMVDESQSEAMSDNLPYL